MAFRSDIEVIWAQSPRVIWVHWTTEASRTLALQDLVDTLRVLESELVSLDDKKLLNAAGKTPLGPGLDTVITATLLNALIAFDPNDAELLDGIVTANDLTGTLLTDGAAHFITDGVAPGDVVDNVTDYSSATVLDVKSETQLLTTPLYEGVTGQYHVGDDYHIHETVDAVISGGNLVAVNAVGASVRIPFIPTQRVYVILTMAAAGSVQDLGAVWDESMAAHLAPGTTGEKLNAAGGAAQPWDELVTDHQDPGSFGKLVKQTKSIAATTMVKVLGE